MLSCWFEMINFGGLKNSQIKSNLSLRHDVNPKANSVPNN